MNSTDKSQVATKNDIEKLNTELKTTEKSLRSEIKTNEKKLRTEILRVEEKVETLQEGQEDMTSALTKLQITLDGFVGAVDDLKKDNIVGAHQIKELDIRATKLESTPHTT